MEFKELKEELLRRAKKASACEDGYEEGLRAQNKSDLLKAITDNWAWVMSVTGIIDARFLEENFTERELTAAHIYTNGYHEIFDNSAFACGSSTVTACGSSTVTACGSSTVKAYDSSTVKACGESYIEDYRGGIRPAGGHAIVKDYFAHKIYLKKGAFEIVEID